MSRFISSFVVVFERIKIIVVGLLAIFSKNSYGVLEHGCIVMVE